MQGFWDNLSGKPEDAFTKTFADVLPNNTLALAQVASCKLKLFNDTDFINLEWELIEGDFKGQHLFQKLNIYDKDVDKATKARNMLMYLVQLFHVKHDPNNAPNDNFLAQFNGKVAGIKIQEWSMQKNDGTLGHGNFISEVHASTGFVSETGKYRDFKHKSVGVDSALTRHSRQEKNELDDDIPF
jgi:hypothetical protein